MEHILGSLASIDELAEAAAPGVPAQQLRVLMQFSHNESLLAALGASKEVSTAQNTCMPFRWSGAQHAQPVCRTAPFARSQSSACNLVELQQIVR